MSEDKRLTETVAASVRRWYDEHGWQRDAGSGLFRDTATFSGAGSSGSPGAAHYEARSYQDLDGTFGAGRYFIDAASGALAHSEYIPWSSEFSARICIDISGVALREARQRLGDHGLYIQANLAQLPLGDNSIDGGVSAYTIQHIAADEQALAVQELARVLATGHYLYILTGVEPTLRHWAYRLLRPVLRGSTYKG
ncbi:MAG: class I SAM-dependent methyltransferase, partial [Geminicoccaceae bacterium]|nr:class I SAM-dependent methyltransferase [Geminicoccaceae bacterium]